MSSTAFTPTVLTVTSGAGAASGEKNYITNPSMATATTGWNVVGDFALTRSTSASELPREYTTATGIKMVATAGTQSTADYIFFDFILDDVDLNKKMKIKWSQKRLGTYAAGQLAVIITTQSDRTTALHTPITTAIPAVDTEFETTFDSGSTAALSIVIRATADMTTNDGLCLSDVIVGPGINAQGAAISEWQSYTPAFSYSAVTNVNMRWRRVGSGIEIQGEYNVGTAGSAEIRIPLPNNYTVSLAGSNTVALAPYLNDATSNTNHYWVIATNGNTYLNVGRWSADGVANRLSASTAGAIATGRHSFTCSVPVAEFAGNGTVNLGAGAQIEFVADDGTNDVFGPLGAAIPTITAGPGGTSRTFSFQYPWQQDDIAVVEIRRTGQTNWEDAGQLTFIRSAANDYYGIRGRWSSSTVYQVDFGNRGYDAAAGFGSNGNSWNDGVFDRWRVRKAKASAPVGFGLATATDSGLSYQNRFQRKVLGSNITSSGAISDFTFNNLVIGRIYRLDITGRFVHTSSASNEKQGIIAITHSGSTLYGPYWLVNPIQTGDAIVQSTSTFVATSTTITMSVNLVNMQLWAPSYASLTEMNDTATTTAFT